MKHTSKLTPIVSITGLALSVLGAQAQNVFNYSNGDLILDFSQSGSSDVEVDLGSLANLQAAAVAGGGTVVLSGAANGYSIASQLSPTFANYNNLSLTVFGTTTGAGTDVDYLTKKRASIGVQNAAPNDVSASIANSGGNDVLGVVGYPQPETGILGYTGSTTANVAIIPPANVNSYTTKGNSALNGLATINSIKNTTGGSFSGSIVSDLFEYSGAGTGSKAVYEGDFTFNSDGSLDFTTAAVTAVPEPRTYGVAAAAGLLLVSLRHQLRRKQA